MKDHNSNNEDIRPTYVSPRAVRLDDVQSGVGGCGVGNSPAGSINCYPTGNGAQVANCGRGNGAPAACVPGNGFKI